MMRRPPRRNGTRVGRARRAGDRGCRGGYRAAVMDQSEPDIDRLDEGTRPDQRLYPEEDPAQEGRSAGTAC